MQPAGRGGIPAFTDTVAFEEYRLRTGDRLFLRVISLDEEMNRLYNIGGTGQTMSGSMSELTTYLVEENGTMSIPNLENVPVAGKTLREVRDTLIELLSPFFMTTTRLDVEVRRVHRYYSIIGEGRSGRFPIDREKINIFEALAQAGDIGIYGKRSRIRIIRETEDGADVITFDVRSEDIIHSKYYYIQDNDVIYIQPMTEKMFGITNIGGLYGTIMSTLSFGTMLYITIDRLSK
jgi:polysaccharide export outer membrane protein